MSDLSPEQRKTLQSAVDRLQRVAAAVERCSDTQLDPAHKAAMRDDVTEAARAVKALLPQETE